MSVSRLGFVSADGGGGGLNEGEVLALIDQETATFVSNPDPPNVLNNNAIPTLVDPSGRIIKRSKVTITNDDELNTNKLTVGDGSYSFPTTIGAPGQILVVPTLGTELKFLDVDPSPVEVDDLQTKTQNILLPLTTPGQTTFIGNTASVSGLTVGLPDAPDAWNLLPGHGQQGDQLLFPGGDSSDAYWGKAPAITVLESKCQNIDYNLTSPTRTEFVGRVSAENGFGFGESPNTWTIPATRGVTSGQQMLWDHTARETYWGEAPRLTTVYNKALNIGNTVPAVSTAFSGLVGADRFLVGSSPNDWKIGPGQGVYGDSLTWPETGSTAVWSVPPSVQTLQDQCQYMTSEPLGTDFALRVVADSLVSNTSLTLDAENPEGSYILPVTRGTPGQVLVAGGISGDQCAFQNNVLSQNQADSLLEKTQFQATDLTGTTFTGQLTATQNLVAPVVSVGHLVQVNSDSLTGSYILPLNRGTPGQVLVSAGDEGESCEFQDATVSPLDLTDIKTKIQNISAPRTIPNFTFVDGDIILSERSLLDFTLQVDTVQTRTQYQSTTELQDRLTTFDGRLRLQPIPGGDAKQVIFPESRANYGGASLRTNMNLTQSELIWQAPSFIRRYLNVQGDPTLSYVMPLPSIPGVDESFMPALVLESKSALDVWQYSSADGITYTGTSRVGVFKVIFSASLTILTNPAPAYIKIRITRADSLGGAQTEMQRRAFIIRKDSDPNLVYLEALGSDLTPNSVINVYVSDYNQAPTLRVYDAVVDVMTF